MAALYSDCIYRCFHDFENSSYTSKLPEELFTKNNTINEGGFNRIALKVDLNTTDGTIEIPCYGKYTFLEELRKYDSTIFGNRNFTTNAPIIYYPIINNYYSCSSFDIAKNEYKSAAPAVQAFFAKTPQTLGVRHMLCGTHNTYWGGKGLILYEDFTPMIMFSLIFEKTEVQSRFIGNLMVPGYKVGVPILRINPVVFYRDDILSKHVRGKLLTEVLACREDLLNTRFQSFGRGMRHIVGGIDYQNFKVIIDKFDYFFDKPKAPSVGITNDALNDFAIQHCQEILQIK